jgi:pantothenate kinase type III
MQLPLTPSHEGDLDHRRFRNRDDLRCRRPGRLLQGRDHRSGHQPVDRRLVNAAAKLPRIAIESPEDDSVIGRTTESQMLIGIYWGYVAMIEGLVERLRKEVGRPVTVIGTGGLAVLFDERTQVFDAVEPDLTIQGLSLLYDGIAAGE